MHCISRSGIAALGGLSKLCLIVATDFPLDCLTYVALKLFCILLLLPSKNANILAMNSLKTLLLLFALSVGSFAGEIQKGATVQVPPNSIWFQDEGRLSKWQQLKASGKPDALADYQQKQLKSRNAFQFDKPLKVKILGYNAAKHQVKVKMENFGPMQGTKWYLDDSALTQ
jgi:hypothetical protein